MSWGSQPKPKAFVACDRASYSFHADLQFTLLPQSTEFWGNIHVPWRSTFEVWLSKMKAPGGAALSASKDLRMNTTWPELLEDLQDEQDLSLSIS